MTRALLAAALTVIAFAASPSAASAGWYDVYACGYAPSGYVGNASWFADVPGPFATAYTGCPGEGIVSRMSVGGGTAPYGAGARQIFTAPPGTRIVRFRANVNVSEFRGWHAGLVDASPRWIWCGTSCTSYLTYVRADVPVNSHQLFAQAVCGNFSGCPRGHLDGLMAMRDVIVTIEDQAPPNIAITGGSVTRPGWHSGDQDVSYHAWDASGVPKVEEFVDGRRVNVEAADCSLARPKPCDDQLRTVRIPGEHFGADGRHRVTLTAVDAVGAVRSASAEIYVDRSAPEKPLDVRVDGGDAWRSRNAFDVRWRNPSQSAAPIDAVRYELCPEATAQGATTGCVDGRVRGRGISSLMGVRVPKPGAWRISVWLEDAADNTDSARSVTVSNLRFDDAPPAVALVKASGAEPMRVMVRASDSPAGIVAAQIEARRRGEAAWRSLET